MFIETLTKKVNKSGISVTTLEVKKIIEEYNTMLGQRREFKESMKIIEDDVLNVVCSQSQRTANSIKRYLASGGLVLSVDNISRIKLDSFRKMHNVGRTTVNELEKIKRLAQQQLKQQVVS